MPPKNTRKAKENGEEAETEDHMVASPSASEASYASSISSAPTSLSLSSAMLESILAARDKSFESSMMSILATLTPSLSAASAAVPTPLPPARPQVKVPKWADDEVPSEFFSKLEKAITHNGVAKTSWGQLLPVYLSGKAQAALAQVPVASLDDYEAVKLVLLESLGDTPTSADRKWWSLCRQAGEDACSFYLRIRAIGIRRLQGLSSKEEILEKLVLSRFMSLLSSDSYSCAMTRQPKDGLEAARIVQELEETRAYSRQRSSWRQDHNHHSQSSRREPYHSGSPNSGGTGSGNSSGGTGSGSPSSGAGVEEVTGGCPSAEAPASSSYKSGTRDRQNRKPIICHCCGEPGHIRPNCPNIVSSVRVPGEGLGMTVDALLVGRPVKAVVDTGCRRTLVHSDYVPSACYTGRKVRICDWTGGRFSNHRLAKIVIQVGDVKRLAVVAVDDSLDCPALLGMDLGAVITEKLMGIVVANAKAALIVSENEVTMHVDTVEPVKVTGAQAKKLAAEDRENNLASAQSECVPVALTDVFNFSDSYFEEEVEVNSVEASVAPVVCDEILVPMQQEEVVVNFVEAYVAPVVEVEVEQLAVAEALSGKDPVPLTDIFNFPDEFFDDDSLPELCVRKEDSYVPVVMKCPITEAQADEVAPGPVVIESDDLSNVFDFADSFFEPDPVFTPVPEVQLVPAKEFIDLTPTKEGTMSSISCWQSSDLANFVKCLLHCHTKATGRLAPGRDTVSKFLLFLFLKFLLFVFFCCSQIFFVLVQVFCAQHLVDASGPVVVLWLHRPGEDLPLSYSSNQLLPRTGIGGFSALPGPGRFLMFSPVGCQTLPLPMRPYLLVGCQKLPLRPRPLVKPKGGEMLWSPPPSNQDSKHSATILAEQFHTQLIVINIFISELSLTELVFLIEPSSLKVLMVRRWISHLFNICCVRPLGLAEAI